MANRSSAASTETNNAGTAKDAAGSAKGEAAGTVARTVRLLRALAEAEHPIGIAALAQRLDLAVSTVHRLLRLLGDEGMVSWDADTHLYTVGTEYYRMSAKVVSKTSLPRLARPVLHALAGRFNETVLLGILQPSQHAMMFAERADGTQALQYRIDLHGLNSLVLGASGKSILAFMSGEEIEAVLAAEATAGHYTITPVPTLGSLEPELNAIRERGYCVSEGQKLPGARGVAAPVFGPTGVVGSICLTSPADRLPHASISTIAEAIMEQANALSELLGASDLAQVTPRLRQA